MKNELNNRNFITAMVLSMAILLGYQFLSGYFFPPKPQQAHTVGAEVPPPVVKPIERQTALGQSPRLSIDTPELSGSVNLKGASLDDLNLKLYRQTVAADSPPVTLLSPSGVANAYFVQQGLINAPGSNAKLPDESTVWSAPPSTKLSVGTPVTLTWDNGAGLKFARTIAIDDNYVFSFTQSVTNTTGQPVSLLPYGLVVRHDTPHIAGFYVFYEGMLGFLGDKAREVKYKDVKGETDGTSFESTGGWLGYTDQYWATAIVPNQAALIKARFRHQMSGDRDVYQTEYVARDPLVVAAGATASSQELVFAGPKIVKMIDAVGEQYKIKGFEYMIDWGYLKPITRAMFSLLETIVYFVGNFGVAILLTTVLVKLLVFPLANKSYASMSKMKKLAPEIKQIKESHPDDRMKQQQATMALYKREKISPASGCLPMFVQIPIFFSLYKVILTSIELRHAPFFGWIHDLSAADPSNLFTLFGLIPWGPPTALHLGVWPLAMGVTMWVQMRLNPAPADAIQQSMFNWMPVVFTYMMKDFPSGLVIYWAWSNFLGILQQSFIMKRHGTEINLLGNIKNSLPFLKKNAAGNTP